MTFTTRPELQGTFGMVATTHWIASAVGMKLLEDGGTAADAAAAAGFVLNVVEPHLNGPLGEMPALVWLAEEDEPIVVCGQGTAPAAATIEHYRAEGLTLVPGSGLLATVVPGAFGAWMLLLRDHGRLRLREVLEPAIHYAEAGHPILPRAAAEIAECVEVFRTEWPTSGHVWLPGGDPPQPGKLFQNPDLAAFWRRLLEEAESVTGREAQIEAARRSFYEGFVAEVIDAYLRHACVLDAAGERRKGVLTADDMAGWRANIEAPLSLDHHGHCVWKCGSWTQGPVLLQSLRMLADDDLAGLCGESGEFVHLVIETLKMAFADREAYYGDPAETAVPMEVLLSEAYGRQRRARVTGQASKVQDPGRVPGCAHLADAFLVRSTRTHSAESGVGIGEPTMAHLNGGQRDTVHLDVIDRWGNVISATPSGGWLKSNPVVPGLGVPLNTRAQMFWLEEGLASSLAPGRRPRTTLSPSVARLSDGTRLAFGTPGGDQQDQWQLIFLLRVLHHGMNLQEAIDSPLFHTKHLQSSFYPREWRPGHLLIESRFSESAIADLRRRGHDLEIAEPWSAGRLTAASRRPDGTLRSAATPRLMQAYAVGR